jgi:hypothetical protein
VREELAPGSGCIEKGEPKIGWSCEVSLQGEMALALRLKEGQDYSSGGVRVISGSQNGMCRDEPALPKDTLAWLFIRTKNSMIYHPYFESKSYSYPFPYLFVSLTSYFSSLSFSSSMYQEIICLLF